MKHHTTGETADSPDGDNNLDRPLLSIIMPLFNVEKYLSQAIESLVTQSIGFKENVELILVNDGSLDQTYEICLRYKKMYPKNISIINQQNYGVSAARNAGLKISSGKYINFFDGDDVWQKNSLKKLVRFIEKHSSEIDVVAANMKFFDADISSHPLSYKFKKTRIINLDKDPDNPIFHLPTCIFKMNVLVGKKFDERLKLSEDVKMLSEVLIHKKKYGVVSGALYNYRKRRDQSSAIGTSTVSKDYYLKTPKYVYNYMADLWSVGGNLHEFMQAVLLYDIQYRIPFKDFGVLNNKEKSLYNKLLAGVIKKINDDNIANSRWLTDNQKGILLQSKNKNKSILNQSADIRKEDRYKCGYKILDILFNWRFEDAIKQFCKLRNYNLSQLTLKSRLFELFKPLLIILETIFDIPRAIFLRIAYYLIKPKLKKPIWLISDRAMSAGDNGEALFRYIQSNKKQEADVYFVISKKSKAEYDRVKKIGRVINQNSLDYLLKFLMSDKIISSHADIEITNPFIRQKNHYNDLFNFDFVFLQHGVIHNDLSGWLNRKDKNIKLFITSSLVEYNSIINDRYGYTKKEVKLTGLPRYDFLENKSSNMLIIAPTYRAFLLNTKTDQSGNRPYDPYFKKSEYFIFYNNLINDKRILQALNDAKMKGELYVHPNFASQTMDFKDNSLIKIAEFPYDYNKAISKGSLMVSDYSSLTFDFAYLKKPVIYAQFDKDQFFSGHTSVKGDFWDYERDGFGVITFSYEDTVNEIVKTISNRCKVVDKYSKRVDKFFTYFDKNNSKRVYEAIKKMKKNN